MDMHTYQLAAARTINKDLAPKSVEAHALHLMAAEVGEIHGIYQKIYQGHEADAEELKKELGDLLWGIAELCTVMGWGLDDIAAMNIEKLRRRYPNGFEAVRSKYREE